jgi:hypothetical protein
MRWIIGHLSSCAFGFLRPRSGAAGRPVDLKVGSIFIPADLKVGGSIFMPADLKVGGSSLGWRGRPSGRP